MTARRLPDAGFSLIETLVALAVLAMSAVALLATTQAHITRIAGLEERAAAAWTAENYLTEASLGLQPGLTPPPMLGFQFTLTVEAETTSDPEVQKLVVNAADAADGRRFVRLTGFVLTDVVGARP